MPPASNQLFTFNDVANEVSAGRMLWSGSSQSGTACLSWSQFASAVSNDGTNPGGYASNQCIPYSYGLARAVTVRPPTNVFVQDNFGGDLVVNWVAPSSGPTPDSYNVQFYRNGSPFGAPVNVLGLGSDKAGYSSGDNAFAWVQSVYHSSTSAYASGNAVTMS